VLPLVLGLGSTVWFWQANRATRDLPEELFRPIFGDENDPPFDVEKTEFEGRPIAALIEQALRGGDDERVFAVHGLHHVHHGCREHCMHSGLSTPPPEIVRRKLAYTQRGLVGPRAAVILPVLLQTITDSHPRVRRASVTTLMSMDAEAFSACDALRKTLQDPDTETRLWAARALYSIRLKTDAPIACAVDVLANDPQPSSRSMAAYNLCIMGKDAKAAVPALEKACQDADPDVQAQAEQALRHVR
jgi:HEAT repeat protein